MERAACAGSSLDVRGRDGGASCTTSTQLEDCETGDAGAIDRGIDCTSVGAGACVTGAPAACAATGDAGCVPTTTVTCDRNGVATGCPSGVVEAVDCNALLGSATGCDPAARTAGGPSWGTSPAAVHGVRSRTPASERLVRQGNPPCVASDCDRRRHFREDCSALGFPTIRVRAQAACRTDPMPHASVVP